MMQGDWLSKENEVGGGPENSLAYEGIFSLEREFAAKFHWVGHDLRMKETVIMREN